jgi:hypothetical protein
MLSHAARFPPGLRAAEMQCPGQAAQAMIALFWQIERPSPVNFYGRKKNWT